MAECLFCDIASGRHQAAVIHEDEHCIVFLDLYPVTRGHTLVVSKHHAERVVGLPEAQYLGMQSVARRVVDAHFAWDDRIEAHNWMINDGPISGQHVPHVHLHVIPRRRGDKPRSLLRLLTRFHPFGVDARRVELDALALELKALLARQG